MVIAHAPTNRSVKGTEDAVAAVGQLRDEGVNVELDLIEGVSRADAMERITRADVLVDQLHIGWYGGVAVEGMALGRPVVCFINESENPFGAAFQLSGPNLLPERRLGRSDRRSRAAGLHRRTGAASALK